MFSVKVHEVETGKEMVTTGMPLADAHKMVDGMVQMADGTTATVENVSVVGDEERAVHFIKEDDIAIIVTIIPTPPEEVISILSFMVATFPQD